MDSTAKEEWLQSFQGATLVLEPEFGSPKAVSYTHLDVYKRQLPE